jgi:hypothetical protein
MPLVRLCRTPQRVPGCYGQGHGEGESGCGIPEAVAEQRGHEAKCSQQSENNRRAPNATRGVATTAIYCALWAEGSPTTTVVPAKAGTHRPLAMS